MNTEELFDDTIDDEEFTPKQDESKYSSLSGLSGLSGEDEDIAEIIGVGQKQYEA